MDAQTFEQDIAEWFAPHSTTSSPHSSSTVSDEEDALRLARNTLVLPPPASAPKTKVNTKVAVRGTSSPQTLSSSVVKKGDRRVKIYERELDSKAVDEARQAAEERTQQFALQCRITAGVQPNRRTRVTAHAGEDINSKRKDRRRELNQNSARVARKRGGFYVEALEDKVIATEEHLKMLVSQLNGAEDVNSSLTNDFEFCRQ